MSQMGAGACISSVLFGGSLGPGKTSKNRARRVAFRREIYLALEEQGALLPLAIPLTLSLVIKRDRPPKDCPDLDNLLNGVMASLDDVAHPTGPRLLCDDRNFICISARYV